MNDNPQFNFDFFKRILSVLKNEFSFCSFYDAANKLYHNNSKPYVLLRHDVDLDLDLALRLALIENDLNVKSCFMIMTNSPFYSLGNKHSQSIVREMIENGHEIGLHFDFHNNSLRNDETGIDQIENDIFESCTELEKITGTRINSISFHKPLAQFLNGPFYVDGRINAYSAELMKWYLSDSKGNWREGNPLKSLEKRRNTILQLLMHPIWWDEKHLDAPDRLQNFFEHRTRNLTVEEKNKFSVSLSSYLSIQRSKRDE
ncbi:MAG: polysaccharide deacetylase family protein [Bacteroidetes bacterium]|nr:polysaccharide deacetylase family protein [Bacteroidota bacterium]MCL6100369.1 polysaccharide deacetylase family protein [Bacteroidota bacterium]